MLPIERLHLRIIGSCLRILERYLSLDEAVRSGIPLVGELPPDVVRRSREERPLPLERCQTLVQRTVANDVRKELAVYYSKDEALRLMEAATDLVDGEVVLGDPFMGSGRTLTHLLPLVRDRLARVWGVERLPLPALVAYTSLLHALDGRSDLIDVRVGDAFLLYARSELPTSNLIATNPPFTRWDKLPKGYRAELLTTFRRTHGEYVGKGSISLQALAMLLIDGLLEEGGVVASVLPASTFYTLYGRGCKRLLRERYHLILLAEGSDSFSEGSGFKELVVVARKGPGKGVTRVVSASGEHSLLDLGDLPPFFDMNWLSLFDAELRDLVLAYIKPAFRAGTLARLSDLGIRVVRGVEMYGPDFFFLPNRYWRLRAGDSGFVITDGGELTIGREYLVEALRRPSLYARTIEVDVDTYLLSIPPLPLEELPPNLVEYVRWGMREGTAGPAVRSKGPMWYSHIWRQLRTKRPFGYLFLPDKVGDPLKRSSLANLTGRRVTASKNFYVLIADREMSEALAAWYNSTLFASLLILMGRKISRGWTRFLLADYLEMPVPSRVTGDVISAFRELVRDPRPLKEDISSDGARKQLDRAMGRALGVPGVDRLLDALYARLLDLSND